MAIWVWSWPGEAIERYRNRAEAAGRSRGTFKGLATGQQAGITPHSAKLLPAAFAVHRWPRGADNIAGMTVPSAPPSPTPRARPLLPLRGTRILSLALNLPGPAALMRCRKMGAACVKLEPPPPAGAAPGATSDPMAFYGRSAYNDLQQGVRLVLADLKSEKGQKTLHRELAKADVLLTSFRPSALRKLGLTWAALHKLYPSLSMVTIVGGPGEQAETAGHDLTYQAENDLITGMESPATLYADMGGALMASEAVLSAVLVQRHKGKGSLIEVALSEAARFLALPRHWGLTQAGTVLGGAHAGYRVYPCKDGRVALAALEPHFAQKLCVAAGVPDASLASLQSPTTRQLIADFLLTKTRKALDKLALEKDIPLHTMQK